MKTLALLILTSLALAACTPAEAAEPRRQTEAATVAAYEANAIAKARQMPEVIRLRFALAQATSPEAKAAISASLYDIIEAAAHNGRQAGLAAVEARRRQDAELHRRWDEERRHEELLLTIQALGR